MKHLYLAIYFVFALYTLHLNISTSQYIALHSIVVALCRAYVWGCIP